MFVVLGGGGWWWRFVGESESKVGNGLGIECEGRFQRLNGEKSERVRD
jgi:hypothetical protein